jgi:hypothetical protein
VCETGMDYPSNLPSPRNCDNRTVLDSASSDSLSSAHGRSGNPDPHCPPKDLACASKDISPDTTALSSIDPNDKKLSGSDRHGYTDSELSHHDSTTSTSSDYSDCDLSFNIALLDHEDTGPEVPPSSSCHNDSPSIMYTANLLDYSGDEVTASSSKAPSIIPQQSDSDSDCELVDIPPSSLQTGMVDLDPPSDSGIPRSTCASRIIPVSTPAAVTLAPAVDPTVNPFSQDAGPDLPSSFTNTCRSAIDPSILSHSHRDSLDNVSVYSSYSDISQQSGAGHCSEHSDCLPSDSDTVESDIESPTCDSSNHPDTSIDPAIPRTLTNGESQQSLDGWRTDVMSWLSGDPNFVAFLGTSTWTRISKTQPFRGFSDDPPPGKSAQQKAWTLDAMLNRIAMLCPSIALRSVNSKCTSLNDVWQSIYVYYCCKL